MLLNQAITIEAATAVVDNFGFGRAVAVINLTDGCGAGCAPQSSGSPRRVSGFSWQSTVSEVLQKIASKIKIVSERGLAARRTNPDLFTNDATAATKTTTREGFLPAVVVAGEPEPLSSSAIRSPLNAISTDPSQILVGEGLARSAGPFPSAAYQEKLFTLEEAAKDSGQGLWNPNACPQPTPVPAHCNIKGNIHWKKRQKLYFPPDCPGYARVTIEPRNGDRLFCSVADAAAAGFTLAATCLPR